MVNKTITKLSLIVLLVSSISYSIEAQEFDFEQTDAVSLIEETLAVDTLVADTAYSDYKYGYKPSLAELAIDSLNNLPNRVEVPDSIIERDSMMTLIAPIMLEKVRLVDNIMVTDATREDFTNIGLPEIVYDYFLQEIGDYNFINQVNEKSAEEIQNDFKRIQNRISIGLNQLDLQKKKQELIDNNIQLFNYFQEKINNGGINSEAAERLRYIYELVSDKLHLVDGKLTVDIPENKESDDFSKKCIQYIQYVIELTNIDFDIDEDSLEDREEKLEWMKDQFTNMAEYLKKYQINKNE